MTLATRDSPAPSTGELRRFGLSVGGVFLLIAVVVAYRRGAGAAAVPPLGVVGAVLVVGGALVPRSLRVVYRAWMAGALAMSRVTTPVFMGVIYFAVLTPFGLVMRLAGRRPLARPPDADSFWVDRPAGSRRSDLHRQF